MVRDSRYCCLCSSFQRSSFVYSMPQSKWNRFKPVLQLHLTSACLSNEACQSPINLVLHDINPASAHFNLLVPIGHCCATPPPFNQLQEKQTSHASVLERNLGSPVTKRITTLTNVQFLNQTALSSNQSTACNGIDTANWSLKHPPVPNVNSADSLNSTGHQTR